MIGKLCKFVIFFLFATMHYIVQIPYVLYNVNGCTTDFNRQISYISHSFTKSKFHHKVSFSSC